jgi:hypothetical protein
MLYDRAGRTEGQHNVLRNIRQLIVTMLYFEIEVVHEQSRLRTVNETTCLTDNFLSNFRAVVSVEILI